MLGPSRGVVKTEGTEERKMSCPKALPYRWGKLARRQLRRLWFRLFRALEKLGLHVLPKSFYTPIADYHWLEKNKSAWIGRSRLTGIEWDLDKQLSWLQDICCSYYQEVRGLHFCEDDVVRAAGPGYGEIESQVLHCFVRRTAPQRIVEIGSGASTMCMLHATELNAHDNRSRSQITCIDPYPSRILKTLSNINVVKQPCQVVSSTLFQQLQRGDLLFIDSSHAVKVGSDVVRIYSEIIPSLPAGIFIHIHDINLPYLYSPSTLSPYFDATSQETVLLVALLTNNKRLSVLASLSALHYDRTQRLVELLSDYEPEDHVEGLSSSFPRQKHLPTSTWLCTS